MILPAQVVYRGFEAVRGDSLIWNLDRNRLRILTYHGICSDSVAGESWVPPYFVKQSDYEAQLAYLKDHAVVLPLSDAIARLQNGTLPPRCMSITFDDGYANNLHLGYPLLQKFGLPATIFLSTAYVHSGDFLPFDRLQLIRSFKPEGPQSQPEDLASLPYKRIPLDSYLRRIRPLWDRVRRQLQEEHCDTLRPLRIEELGAFDPRLIELGAHTHTHAILRNETPQRREQELLLSVRNVREWTGGRVTLFSYPNGEQGDFDDTDKEILQSQGIMAAFSTVPGANSSDCDWMAMKRYSVGLWHSKSAFVSEVTGFRSGLRSLFAKR